MKKLRNITIIARAWYGNVNGNSEYVADVYIDGVALFRVSTKMHGGTAGMYEQMCADELEKAGYMEGREHHENGAKESLWIYYDRHGQRKDYLAACTTVGRRKDL